MTKIYVKALVEKVNDADGVLQVSIASTGATDRQGEIIDQGGWQLDNFRKNPVLMWAHNYDMPPIGKVEDIGVVEGRLMFKAKLATEISAFAKEIYQMFKEGYLNAFSVGFQPLERKDGDTFKSVELLEISAVPVPANPQALVMMRSLGFKAVKGDHAVCDPDSSEYDPDKCAEAMKDKPKEEGKGVVPYATYPTIDRAWDADAAQQRMRAWAGGDNIDFGKYAKGFAWFDSAAADQFGSYKLPHHDIVDGDIVTNLRSVIAAMAALLGARGGVDMPEADRRGVYNHLSKHYAEYDREAPEFRSYNDEELAKVSAGLPSNYVLSFENRGKINLTIEALKTAADALQELARLGASFTDNDGAAKAGSGASEEKVIRIISTEAKRAVQSIEKINRVIKIGSPSK